MSRQHSHSGLILPVIRKVITRDDHFICSICRSEYPSKVEANNCLNHCWYDVQELYPVVVRKHHGRFIVYRCHYCCRDYQEESEALACAQRCVGVRNKLHVHEQLVNDLPIEAPTHRPSRIRLVAMKAVPARPAPKPKQEEVAEPVDQTSEVEETEEFAPAQAAAAPAPKPAPAPEPEPELRRTKKDFPKPFVRMDARYKCGYCGNQVFTKMEIEACFNSHFDEEGYEKRPGG